MGDRALSTQSEGSTLLTGRRVGEASAELRPEHDAVDILSSRPLYSGKYFQVEGIHARFRDGKEAPDWHVIKLVEGVGVIPVTSGGNFVMIREARIPTRSITYGFPAGSRFDQQGQTAAEIALHEMEEEAGYSTDPDHILPLDRAYIDSGMSPSAHERFLALGVEKKHDGDHGSEESIAEVVEVTPAQLMDMLRRAQAGEQMFTSVGHMVGAYEALVTLGYLKQAGDESVVRETARRLMERIHGAPVEVGERDIVRPVDDAIAALREQIPPEYQPIVFYMGSQMKPGTDRYEILKEIARQLSTAEAGSGRKFGVMVGDQAVGGMEAVTQGVEEGNGFGIGVMARQYPTGDSQRQAWKAYTTVETASERATVMDALAAGVVCMGGAGTDQEMFTSWVNTYSSTKQLPDDQVRPVVILVDDTVSEFGVDREIVANYINHKTAGEPLKRRVFKIMDISRDSVATWLAEKHPQQADINLADTNPYHKFAAAMVVELLQERL